MQAASQWASYTDCKTNPQISVVNVLHINKSPISQWIRFKFTQNVDMWRNTEIMALEHHHPSIHRRHRANCSNQLGICLAYFVLLCTKLSHFYFCYQSTFKTPKYVALIDLSLTQTYIILAQNIILWTRVKRWKFLSIKSIEAILCVWKTNKQYTLNQPTMIGKEIFWSISKLFYPTGAQFYQSNWFIECDQQIGTDGQCTASMIWIDMIGCASLLTRPLKI